MSDKTTEYRALSQKHLQSALDDAAMAKAKLLRSARCAEHAGRGYRATELRMLAESMAGEIRGLEGFLVDRSPDGFPSDYDGKGSDEA